MAIDLSGAPSPERWFQPVEPPLAQQIVDAADAEGVRLGLGQGELGVAEAERRDLAGQGGLDHDQARDFVEAKADHVAAVGIAGAGRADLAGQVGTASVRQAASLMS